MWGLDSRLCPPMIDKISFSKLSLIPIPSFCISPRNFCRCSSRSSMRNRDEITVARSFSGPQADSGAFGLAGAKEAFVLLLSALSIAFMNKFYTLSLNVLNLKSPHKQLPDMTLTLRNGIH